MIQVWNPETCRGQVRFDLRIKAKVNASILTRSCLAIATELTFHLSLPVWTQSFKLGPTRREGQFGQKDTEQSLGIEVSNR